jgi:hypothetical protein
MPFVTDLRLTRSRSSQRGMRDRAAFSWREWRIDRQHRRPVERAGDSRPTQTNGRNDRDLNESCLEPLRDRADLRLRMLEVAFPVAAIARDHFTAPSGRGRGIRLSLAWPAVGSITEHGRDLLVDVENAGVVEEHLAAVGDHPFDRFVHGVVECRRPFSAIWE